MSRHSPVPPDDADETVCRWPIPRGGLRSRSGSGRCPARTPRPTTSNSYVSSDLDQTLFLEPAATIPGWSVAESTIDPHYSEPSAISIIADHRTRDPGPSTWRRGRVLHSQRTRQSCTAGEFRVAFEQSWNPLPETESSAGQTSTSRWWCGPELSRTGRIAGRPRAS